MLPDMPALRMVAPGAIPLNVVLLLATALATSVECPGVGPLLLYAGRVAPGWRKQLLLLLQTKLLIILINKSKMFLKNYAPLSYKMVGIFILYVLKMV